LQKIWKEDQAEVMIEGLYNFAKLPGDLEDLIELPGNTIITLVSEHE